MTEQPATAGPPDEERPGREPVFNLAPMVVAFIALCVGIHAVRALLLDVEQDLWLIVRFAFIPLRYSGDYLLDLYAFVSPLSYSLLHGGFGHLAVNMVWLAAFGSPLALRIGATRLILFWCATALGAVALHFALYADSATPLVGASGAISGMMGAAARFGFRVDRRARVPAFAGAILSIAQVLRSRTVLIFLGVWMVVNVVAGIGLGGDSQIAWEAHIGGFVVGFLAVRLFDRPARGEAEG